MRKLLVVISLAFLCLLGCTSNREVEPEGPIARSGTTPTIDGVFDDGEWDDATVVPAGEYQQFRIKHDGKNLYFAFAGGGGDIWFNKESGLHILHSSAQLGSAEYIRTDSSAQTLINPFEYKLWELQNQPTAKIQEELAAYLAENRWVASIMPLGNNRETEFAVSFEWLGVTEESKRFFEIPSIYVFSGMLFSRGDPEVEKFRALSPEERKRLYPTLSWPSENKPNDILGMGRAPLTIELDSACWGKIWIDLKNQKTVK